jgi:hypothetical protein
VPCIYYLCSRTPGFDDENATNRYVIRRTVAVAVAVAGVGGVGVLNIERSPLDFVFLAESAVESQV